jgi:two-component system, LytTR family, response regulator LytT
MLKTKDAGCVHICFDIYSQVAIEAPIIFCTAFDEYVARAFETSGIAYLLKPIVPAKVADTFRKYDNLKAALGKGGGFNVRQIEPLLAQYPSPYHSTRIINVREKIMPVKADTIAFLYYNNGVVGITLFNAQQYFVEDTMEALEVKLNPAMFFLVNRQYIVHRHSVQEIERYFSRKLLVKLNLKRAGAGPC